MKEFKSMADFSAHLSKSVKNYEKYEKKAGIFLGETLRKEAQDKIGHLQDHVGEFPAWKELADSTKADKLRNDYVFNADFNPLYRTGEMRDSIHFSYIPALHLLFLGSTSDIMLWQEEGTQHIPPRPVLGPTMFQAKMLVEYVFGKMLIDYIMGKPFIPRKNTYGSL